MGFIPDLCWLNCPGGPHQFHLMDDAVMDGQSDCSTLSCKTQARCFSMTSHLKDGEQQAKVGVQLELCPSRKPQWRQKCDSKASPRSCALYSFVFQRGSCTCSSPVSAADPVLMEGAWKHCMGPPFRWAWGAGERGQGQPDSKPHSD